MRAIVQMRNAVKAIDGYDGNLPLPIYLKQFFRLHKEMGSRDRKFLQQLVYQYFRLNHAIINEDKEAKIALAHWLCANINDDFIKHWSKEKRFDIIIQEKSQNENIEQAIKNGFIHNISQQFPAVNEISSLVEKEKFLQNHLKQPYIWIRCKRKRIESIKAELKLKDIAFHTHDLSSYALGFSQKINFEELESYNKGWFEVQDLSSQATGNFFDVHLNENWWDCCAASGGKSLLLKDIEHSIQLTVSDSRESILQNLKNRFHKASISDYMSVIIDLEHNRFNRDYLFNAVLLDAPCTGSGTWARNPERMTYFKKEEIENYVSKQKNILSNVIHNIAPKGKLVYITCSVYKKENENVVNDFCDKKNMQVELMQYIKGYENYADTMFVAVMKFKQ